ncbi:MAG: hypothetical protein H7A21_11225 [Spirochaetales bacterium]|nr:hypothetical protein [Leptospiraceae bacterium]MCP5481997.1 hypothetical protein [Spirochaetales bacterium]
MTALILTGLLSWTDLLAFPKEEWDSIVREFEAGHGAAVVLITEPRSGRIEYASNLSRALNLVRSPGSLAKVWFALTVGSANETVRCSGRFYPEPFMQIEPEDERTFHILRDENGQPYIACSVRHGHGLMNLTSALTHSCNGYFLTLAAREPRQSLQNMIDRLGLLEHPGTGVREATETPARIRTAPLSPLAATASAIGEGGAISLTPIRIAQTFGALFEGNGLLMRPILQGPSGSAARIAPGPNLGRVLEGLRHVADDGTLEGLESEVERSGGPRIIFAKTGTPTVRDRRYQTHGWVVLYFEYLGANYLLTVFVERGSGGQEARALTRSILLGLH